MPGPDRKAVIRAEWAGTMVLADVIMLLRDPLLRHWTARTGSDKIHRYDRGEPDEGRGHGHGTGQPVQGPRSRP